MSMKKLALIIAGTVLAGMAQAAVLYSESFETYSNGTLKATGWSTIGNTNYVNVASNPAIATAGNKYVVWTNLGQATAVDPNAVTRLYRSNMQKAISNTAFVVEWDFNMAARQASAYTYCDVIYNSGTASTITRVQFDNGLIKYARNGNVVANNNAVTYSTNNWYRVQVTAKTNNTFDLNILDLTAGGGSVFSIFGQTNAVGSSAITNMYGLQWNTGNATPARWSTMYIDNILVTSIPEPATMSLLVVSGVGILLLRRIKRD